MKQYDIKLLYEGSSLYGKKYTTLIHTLHLIVTLLTNFITNYIISFFHEMSLDRSVLRIKVIAKWSSHWWLPCQLIVCIQWKNKLTF